MEPRDGIVFVASNTVTTYGSNTVNKLPVSTQPLTLLSSKKIVKYLVKYNVVYNVIPNQKFNNPRVRVAILLKN